jgi:hypothetical protein
VPSPSDASTPGFAVEDLVSGHSLARGRTLEQAVAIVRAMARCWPGSEDEVVIMPMTPSTLGR